LLLLICARDTVPRSEAHKTVFPDEFQQTAGAKRVRRRIQLVLYG
jgi:hypothetical protein